MNYKDFIIDKGHDMVDAHSKFTSLGFKPQASEKYILFNF